MSVSVIIPTFNRGGLIGETLDSIFSQQVPGMQVIVVDDGSTDDTRSVVSTYGDSVNYIYQGNMGIGAARNRALQEADQPYIAFLDSDDIWMPFKTRLQLEIMETYPQISFLYTDFFIFKEGGVTIPQGLSTWFENDMDWSSVFREKIDVTHLVRQFVDTDDKVFLYTGNIYKTMLVEPLVLPSTSIVRSKDIPEGLILPEPRNQTLTGDWEYFSVMAKVRTAGFLDMETTWNRGHKDPVRLTVSAGEDEHAAARLNLVSRVWRRDEEFMQENSALVHEVEEKQYLILARCALRNSDMTKARESISHVRFRWTPIRIPVLHVLTRIPFGGVLVPLLLKSVKKVHNLFKP